MFAAACRSWAWYARWSWDGEDAAECVFRYFQCVRNADTIAVGAPPSQGAPMNFPPPGMPGPPPGFAGRPPGFPPGMPFPPPGFGGPGGPPPPGCVSAFMCWTLSLTSIALQIPAAIVWSVHHLSRRFCTILMKISQQKRRKDFRAVLTRVHCSLYSVSSCSTVTHCFQATCYPLDDFVAHEDSDSSNGL